MCILLYVSFIWLYVYAFAIHCMVHCGSAFEPVLITAPPFVCVPDVIGALACGFQPQKTKIILHTKRLEFCQEYPNEHCHLWMKRAHAYMELGQYCTCINQVKHAITILASSSSMITPNLPLKHVEISWYYSRRLGATSPSATTIEPCSFIRSSGTTAGFRNSKILSTLHRLALPLSSARAHTTKNPRSSCKPSRCPSMHSRL